ncbi:MAG: ribosome-associated translation inhibitor RaiA [Spirochaetales bacterium]
MNITIKGVHYDISDRTREFISEKLSHIDPFKDLIVTVEVTVTKEKASFQVESNVHFRFGSNVHLTESHLELYPAIENLMHKLDAKVSKEKDKLKEHHPHGHTVKEEEVE